MNMQRSASSILQLTFKKHTSSKKYDLSPLYFLTGLLISRKDDISEFCVFVF